MSRLVGFLAFIGVSVASTACRQAIDLAGLTVDPPAARTGGAGSPCVKPAECDSRVCARGTCQNPLCTDGAKNGAETDIDCGGDCSGCAAGARCRASGDCVTGVCTIGLCWAPTCTDGVHNGEESDVDCGGGACPPCRLGASCSPSSPGDCASGVCDGSCVSPPSCSDGVKDGTETDVDCGGPACSPCRAGAPCTVPSDCASGSCVDAPDGGASRQSCGMSPTCHDGVLNGTETDLDCGGPACSSCAVGAKCGIPADCESVLCSGTCQSSPCADGVKNNSETDVDCGGDSCAPCRDGAFCYQSTDCTSGVCWGTCRSPTCTDGVKNGTEAGVDCGGSCAACVDAPCTGSSDCKSGVCSGGVCLSALCAAPPCLAGQTCGPSAAQPSPANCASGVCSEIDYVDAIGYLCAAPTCADGVENGTETDVDCGSGAASASCPPCQVLQRCKLDTDCSSATCIDGLCVDAACRNGVKDDWEVDVDCGGPACAPCNCAGLPSSCGSTQDENCCLSPVVKGGANFRYAAGKTYHATVSDVRLDRFEITVGRFRRFVAAWDGGWRPAAGAGKHAHLNAGSGLVATTGGYELGWDPTWADGIATTSAAWDANLACNLAAHPTYPTWTSTPKDEAMPLSCATWYELYAFCIWDGGFLPTEAELHYAAAGGNEDRQFPWQGPAILAGTIDCTFANYDDVRQVGGQSHYCVSPGIGGPNVVGSESPRGDGKYGQADLAGNLAEWTLDAHASLPEPCADCVNTAPASTQTERGGSFFTDDTYAMSSSLVGLAPGTRHSTVGARCARSP